MPRKSAVAALLAVLATGCGDPADPSSEPGAIVQAPTEKAQLLACPLKEHDADALRALAESRDFAALDAQAEAARTAWNETADCEGRVTRLGDVFESLDMELLDAWIAARPDSLAAHTARAAKWVAYGFRLRGGEYARRVSSEQRDAMREAFANAKPDLDRAVAIDAGAFEPAILEISMLRAERDAEKARARLDALVAHDPRSFNAWKAALDVQYPGSGGSMNALRAIAKDAQRYADRNPRLRILPGFVEVEAHAIPLHQEKRFAEAAASYRKALQYGHYLTWYQYLMQCLQAQGDWNGVLEASGPWTAALGDKHPESHAWRGRALYELDRKPEALAEYDKALGYSPKFVWALQLRAQLRRELGMLTEAVSDLELLLEKRYDPWATNLLAYVASADSHSVERSASLVRSLVERHPEDAAAWFVLGSALHASGSPEARAALERYVALAHANSDEQTRVAMARRMLQPQTPGSPGLPAQAHIGLAPRS